MLRRNRILPWGDLCDLRITWFVISPHLVTVNQAQSTKTTSKGPRILVFTWACVLRKKAPTHILRNESMLNSLIILHSLMCDIKIWREQVHMNVSYRWFKTMVKYGFTLCTKYSLYLYTQNKKLSTKFFQT